jgi:hypothetical protein
MYKSKLMKTRFIFFMLLLLIFSSCVSLTGYQTARTVGKKETVGTGSVTYLYAPSFYLNTTTPNEYFGLSGDVAYSIFTTEVGVTHGLAKRLDVGFRCKLIGSYLIDAKYQLLGDHETKFAFAIGGGVGGNLITAGGSYINNFHLPIYGSFHPNKSLSFYLSPRYVYQSGIMIQNSVEELNYWGANMGFLYGRKVKYGVDISYYDIEREGVATGLNLYQLQVGLGVKVIF